MTDVTLTTDMTVADVLERWPEAVVVFQKLRTACVGCAMASFDTLEDVADIYHFDPAYITALLSEIIDDRAEANVER